MKLVIASRNKHKVAEIQTLLAGAPGLTVVSLDGYAVPQIVEDRDAFLGNALKKAVETAGYIKETVLADDSGLSVDALNGAPGVYSARYAGDGASSARLCAKLLRELEGIPAARRTARFTAALAVAAPDGRVLHTAEGIVEGVIASEIRGVNGFGYDPVFYYPPLKKTFAEMSPAEKNLHSHRYRALRELLKKLRN
ncbi:MAG: RdgB/HAM1 family non-canonical purine NTP pyrophosphatase [Candidatus Margulisbacteria bacterium]|jgi:XTP/dITP diphosphohydrolase|nr:RdgB/HAM1 family non-canonical purine NTP pyrophosphatase [Candidatus Margulisiibacteriota bacterium]